MIKEQEWKMKERGVVSDKQRLFQDLETIFLNATSQKDFYSKISASGYTLYYRGGRVYGVVLSKTHRIRFRTIGYSKELLQRLSKTLTKDLRLNSLKKIRELQKGRDLGRELKK